MLSVKYTHKLKTTPNLGTLLYRYSVLLSNHAGTLRCKPLSLTQLSPAHLEQCHLTVPTFYRIRNHIATHCCGWLRKQPSQYLIRGTWTERAHATLPTLLMHLTYSRTHTVLEI